MQTIILADYGGPESLQQVKPFLGNMFSDKEILAVPAPVRFFLRHIIVHARAKKSTAIYAAIGNKSPVNENVRALCAKLNGWQQQLHFVPGFRYTAPLVRDVFAQYAGKAIIFPLFPHYSFATYRTIGNDSNHANLAPENAYYNDLQFLDIVAEQIHCRLKTFDLQQTMLLFTAHSIPQSFVDRGDPYIEQVQANVRELSKRFAQLQVKLAFQSRLGPVKWVGPFLQEVLQTARTQGIEQVLIYPLSFTVDNSETIYELDIMVRELCQSLGYRKFGRVSCLNRDDRFCEFIIKRVEKIL